MKISVIIPMWNAASTLREACESVLQQSYQDFELILVDNASTDDTYSIALEIASTNDRIRVLKEPMIGVSYARKKGFLEATGEYVYFMDADDILPYHSLETFVNMIDESHPDMIEGNYRKITPEVSLEMLQEADQLCGRYLQYQMVPMKHLIDLDAGLWSHIYKRELIQEHFFVPLQQLEDNLFNYYAFLHANKVVYTQRIVYYLNRSHHELVGNSLSSVYHTISPKRLFDEFVKLFQAYLEQDQLEKYEEELQVIMGSLYVVMASRIMYLFHERMEGEEKHDSKYKDVDVYLSELMNVLDMIQIWHNPYIEDDFLFQIEDVYHDCHPGSSLREDRNLELFQPIYVKKRGKNLC